MSLRDLVAEGVVPDAVHLLPRHAVLVNGLIANYGTFSAVCEQAGIERPRIAYTDALVIERLRVLDACGVRMTPRRLRILGEDALIRACISHFGSWAAARDAAKLAKPPPRALPEGLTADMVLDALRRRAAKTGVLAAVDVDRPLARDARAFFGSVTSAIDAAGIRRRRPLQRWTRESLVDALREHAARGELLTHAALVASGRSDLASAVQRHFGTMEAARAAITARETTDASAIASTRAPHRRKQSAADDVAGHAHDPIDALLGNLESELRRMALDLVDTIIEDERTRRAAFIADGLKAAFDAVAVRQKRDEPTATSPEPIEEPPRTQATAARRDDQASHATVEVPHRRSSESIVTSVGDRAWVMADDDHARGRDEPGAVAGVVRWFDEGKGFGFIVGADGRDVFVHCKHIRGRGDRVLREGEQVVYREQEGPRGRYATHVRVL